MGNRKKGKKKQAYLQPEEAREPSGQPHPGLVRRPQKKQEKKKNKAKAKAQSQVVSRRHRDLPTEPVDLVPEDFIFRHHEVQKAHGDAVMAIVMMEDSIYTAARDRLLKRWKPVRNAAGRFELHSDLEVPLGEVAWCLISVGEWLFCGLGTGEIRGFSKAGAQAKMEGHKKKVTCLLMHQHVLLSGSSDGTVRCWQMDPQTQSFACTHSITDGLTGAVSCMSVLNDRLWVGGTSGVALVDLSTLRAGVVLPPIKFVAGMLQFTGHMIVIYQEGSVIIFNGSGEKTHQQPPLAAGPATCLAGLDSGPRILCGHAKGQVSSITLPMFQLKHCWQSFARCKVSSMCSAGHDGIFVLGAENGTIQIWQRIEG